MTLKQIEEVFLKDDGSLAEEFFAEGIGRVQAVSGSNYPVGEEDIDNI